MVGMRTIESGVLVLLMISLKFAKSGRVVLGGMRMVAMMIYLFI